MVLTRRAVYAAIDQYFQGSAHKEEKAALWRCIYNNKIPLTPASGILGEQAFTIYSGWLYSIGGETFYPGTSMSNWRLKDHDTLVLRYTLACGWDVGATMGSEGKGSAGYCAGCTNGDMVGQSHLPKAEGWNLCLHCVRPDAGLPAHQQPLEGSRQRQLHPDLR